jgi:G3E family GTPase
MLTGEMPVPKRLIIETTGLADPAPVIAELLRIGEKPLFENRTLGAVSFSLQSVVTLVSTVTAISISTITSKHSSR